MLHVKLLESNARVPEVAHPGEDLGYDVFATHNAVLIPGKPTKVGTGIAVQFNTEDPNKKFGLLVRDRSSWASLGVFTTAGVIDSRYTGEVKILMTATETAVTIRAGEKIAQLIPLEVHTEAEVKVVQELQIGARGDNGFGSTGKS
jgi:dUTP pyrophosphatase